MKFVDELAKVGVKFKLANDEVANAELEAQRLREVSHLALEKERTALSMLNDYIEKKVKMKELGPEDYKKVKESYMPAEKNL